MWVLLKKEQRQCELVSWSLNHTVIFDYFFLFGSLSNHNKGRILTKDSDFFFYFLFSFDFLSTTLGVAYIITFLTDFTFSNARVSNWWPLGKSWSANMLCMIYTIFLRYVNTWSAFWNVYTICLAHLFVSPFICNPDLVFLFLNPSCSSLPN